jgi:uncharacterized protein YndB with AHSA1/START domain
MTLTQETTDQDQARLIAATRKYKASKELLMRMWANPEHLTNWWGPVGFSITTFEMDFKTGGVWRFTMNAPNGQKYPNQIRYRLVSPNRIEFDHSPGNGVVDFSVTVLFTEMGDETEMSFTSTFASIEQKELSETKFHAREGLAMTLSRLDELVVRQDPNALELVIVRKFKAPQALVWKALTDEEDIQKWGCPLGLKLQRVTGQLKAGGRWESSMISPDGDSYDSEGEYLEVIPTSTLKYTHRWKKEDGTFKPTTTISVGLTENEGMTTMVFVQAGFWSEEAKFAHLGGWTSSFHKLALLVDPTMGSETLNLVREFHATIDLVWKSWTEPERLAAWFAPKPYTVPRCEIDLRPGGMFTLVMRGPDGQEHPMMAQFTDVEPNSSLGWVCSVLGFDQEIALQGGTNIYFEDLGKTARVSVHAYMGAVTEQGKMMAGGMEIGWNMTLDQLGEVLA